MTRTAENGESCAGSRQGGAACRRDAHGLRVSGATDGHRFGLPLADAPAFKFSKPIFTTAIAAILLREPVGARRWIAPVTGFAGVLVMLRPGSGGVDVIAVVAAALTFANVLIRILARTEPTKRILFHYNVMKAVAQAGNCPPASVHAVINKGGTEKGP